MVPARSARSFSWWELVCTTQSRREDDDDADDFGQTCSSPVVESLSTSEPSSRVYLRTLGPVLALLSPLVFLSLVQLGTQPPCRPSSRATACMLILRQGYLYHRFLDSRRWCQGASHPHKEPDLHYLLRSRRHLRRHHGDRLLRQGLRRYRRGALLARLLLHWLCAVLVRHYSRVV